MSAIVCSICATENGTYTALPTPEEFNPSWQSLDSSKSGRDNNTGKMFRDKVAEKATFKYPMPYGVTNTEMATIMGIITRGSFYVKAMNVKTGTFDKFNVYCASCEPTIDRVTATNANNEPTAWIYDGFELSFVEM